MKNKFLSFALGALLLCAVPSLAAETSVVPLPSEEPLVTTMAKQSDLSFIHGFMQEKDFPNGVSASSLPLKDDSGKDVFFWTTTHENGEDVVFLTAAFEVEHKDLPKEFLGMFHEETIPAESIAYIKKLNYYIAGYGYLLNQKVVDIVKTYNERVATGSIPYNIFVIDQGMTEQIHRVPQDPQMLTASINPKLYVDSWLLPVYVRAYAKNKGTKVQFIVTASLDSSKKEADAMAKQLVGLKK